MKRKIIIGIISIACGMAAMSAMQSCRKDDNGGGGGGNPDPDLVVTASMNYSGAAGVILNGETTKNTLYGYYRFFEMDTNPDPRTVYKCSETEAKQSFHTESIPAPPVNDTKIYYRAVVVKDKDTTRSQVMSFDAVQFPFISFDLTVNGSTLIADGQFTQKYFDKARLNELKMFVYEAKNGKLRGTIDAGQNVADQVADDGSFRFTFPGLYREGEIDGYGAVCSGDYYMGPEYVYYGSGYEYMEESAPKSFFFHIDSDPGITLSDKAFNDYAVTAFGSNGKLTLSQAEAAKGIDVRGLGVKSLEGLELFRNIAFLYCDDNPLTEIDLPESLESLKRVTCSECEQLKIIKSYSFALSFLDFHGCRAFDYVKNIGADTVICYSCNLDDSGKFNIGSYTDCHDNNLTRITASSSRRYLNCSHNKLTKITLRSGQEEMLLDSLDCSYNLLETIDISYCTHLKKLDCSNNPSLTTLYVNADQMAHPEFIIKDEQTTITLKQ